MIEKTISVIIPTYCRKKYLLDVLECLKKQTILPLETFIIDSSPESERFAENEISQFPPWLNYKTCENIKNIPWKKNMMISLCSGDLILFLDDDILFEETLIEDYLDCFEDTGADGISGLVLLPGEKMSPNPVLPQGGWLGNTGAPNVRSLNKIIDSRAICTANFSIKRDVIGQIGGFDEQIPGTWDDTELGYRLTDAGYKVIHHPKPAVIHFKPNEGGSRSDDDGLFFAVSNVFYFHIKHSTINPPLFVYLLGVWSYCRPGRRWLKLMFMLRRCQVIFRAIMITRKRIKQGPKYLSLYVDLPQAKND